MNEIKDKDLTFTYDAYGYMLYYKGKPIGGAQCKPDRPKVGMAVVSNREYYRGQAQLTMNQISQGRVPHYMAEAIKTIEGK